jgi:pimeloyl-ACP methyl ester carboxylesterase
MGGYATLALFRKYPDLFKGMILTATRSGPDSPEGKANRDAGVKNVREHGVAFIVDNMLPKLVSPGTYASNQGLIDAIRDITLETSVNGVVGALQGMRDRPDSTPLLSQVKCPTLIIHGADDQLIPVKEAESMHQQLPGSRLAIIPEAGHLLNMEQPELFNQVVREFLSTLL